MDFAREFRAHAEDCRRMAQTIASEEDREIWNRMAERWLVCAKLAEWEETVLDATRERRKARQYAGVSGRGT